MRPCSKREAILHLKKYVSIIYLYKHNETILDQQSMSPSSNQK